MTQQHPITPPSELLQLWGDQHYGCNKGFNELLIEAAQWGADAELEACCEWLQDPDLNVDTYKLRAARRPKPQSLNSIALQMLSTIEKMDVVIPEITDTIRRALEQLPNHTSEEP